MDIEKELEPEKEEERKAGYLVLRIKMGFGIIINDSVEVRVSSIKNKNEVQLAVRAPKNIPIRKVR